MPLSMLDLSDHTSSFYYNDGTFSLKRRMGLPRIRDCHPNRINKDIIFFLPSPPPNFFCLQLPLSSQSSHSSLLPLYPFLSLPSLPLLPSSHFLPSFHLSLLSTYLLGYKTSTIWPMIISPALRKELIKYSLVFHIYA